MKKNFTLIVLLTIITLSKPTFINAQTFQQDSLALVDLYNNTDGQHWVNHTNWLTTQPLSSWFGVTLNNGRVKNVDLQKNGLNGRLPVSLGNITRLQELALDDNSLKDSIPSSLGNLLILEYINFGDNQLTGSIPASLGNSPYFHRLNLSSNQLTGRIPAHLFAVARYLGNVDLSYNKLSGSIPDTLVGAIEANIFNFSYNNLSGSIPPVYRYFKGTLHLNNNQLTGTIPFFTTSFEEYTHLEDVDLSYNQLTGAIPSNLTKLTALTSLRLNNNQLSGQMPAFGKGSNIVTLDLSYNLLTGHIPPSIDSAANLNLINLSHNQIAGTLPSSLGNLITALSTLTLNNNLITGSIPKELGRLRAHLHYLYLSNNKLTGSIPDSIENMRHLYTLDLSNNGLTGAIPASLGNLALLHQLVLNDNKLTGKIPSSFDSLAMIDTIKLQHNNLSGTVPSLQNLIHIDKLSLRLNAFTFSGFETIQQQFGSNALYDNQAIIPLHQHNNSLAVTAGGTLSNNTYTWYKDGAVYTTHTGDSTLPITTSGSYYVSVTNSIATGLTLYSDTLTVTGFNQPAATISIYPNPASSNATALFNATGNYTLMLSNASGKVLQTISGTSNKVQNKVDFNISAYPQGMYFISIKDEKETRLLKLTKE